MLARPRSRSSPTRWRSRGRCVRLRGVACGDGHRRRLLAAPEVLLLDGERTRALNITLRLTSPSMVLRSSYTVGSFSRPPSVSRPCSTSAPAQRDLAPRDVDDAGTAGGGA